MINSTPRALVLGGHSGLLGKTLANTLTGAGWKVAVSPPSSQQDMSKGNTYDILSRMVDSAEPSVIFNAIAYTRVDDAESDQDRATFLNATLPDQLARVTQSRPCRLVHFSTDFVFDGKGSEPYKVTAKTGPLCVYGKTKLAGEEAILARALPEHTIIRTAWLFGPGKNNFITTILRLCKEKQNLSVVHDQWGSPTYTVDLAQNTLALVQTEANGIFHLVNFGVANWCDLASEAVRLAGYGCSVHPIPSAEYPQKAVRPAYSVLDTSSFSKVTGVTPRPWPQALRDYIYREFLVH